MIAVAVVKHNTREHLRGCLATVAPEQPAEELLTLLLTPGQRHEAKHVAISSA